VLAVTDAVIVARGLWSGVRDRPEMTLLVHAEAIET
jgi:hypothetical protein